MPYLAMSSYNVIISANSSTVMLNYSYGDREHNNDMTQIYGSWTKARCDMPSDNDIKGNCVAISCSHGYVRRPRGACAQIYLLVVGFPNDNFKITLKQMNSVSKLIRCRLKFLDLIEDETAGPEVKVFRRKLMIVTPVYFYSDISLPLAMHDWRSVRLVSTLARIAKLFKYLRMIAANNDKGFSSSYDSTLNKLEIKLKIPPKFAVHQLQDIVRGEKSPKGPKAQLIRSARACLCTVPLHRPSVNCSLICFKHKVYEEDLDISNSTDLCLNQFIESMKSTGDKVVVKWYTVHFFAISKLSFIYMLKPTFNFYSFVF